LQRSKQHHVSRLSPLNEKWRGEGNWGKGAWLGKTRKMDKLQRRHRKSFYWELSGMMKLYHLMYQKGLTVKVVVEEA
jgi:hypothetical protein